MSSILFAMIIARRLSENPHLLCYPHPSSLRRTYMYASFLGISDALHMEIFHQPPMELVLRQAPSIGTSRYLADGLSKGDVYICGGFVIVKSLFCP